MAAHGQRAKPPTVLVTVAILLPVLLAIPGAIADWRLFLRVGKWSTALAIVITAFCATTYYRVRTTPVPRSGVPRYLWILTIIGVGVSLSAVPDLLRVYRTDVAPKELRDPAQSLDWRNQRIVSGVFDSQNLRRSQLQNSRLVGVDFSGSDLSESDLRSAVLDNVNLAGVNLCGADLRGADLRRAINLSEVSSWSYAVYDGATRTPDDVSLDVIPGPIKAYNRDILYSCKPNETRVLRIDGTRT
jgi:hypothetical protein